MPDGWRPVAAFRVDSTGKSPTVAESGTDMASTGMHGPAQTAAQPQRPAASLKSPLSPKIHEPEPVSQDESDTMALHGESNAEAQ